MLELSSVEKFISEILSFFRWEESWIFFLVSGSILITNSWGFCSKLKKAQLISRSDAWIIHLMTFPFSSITTHGFDLITEINNENTQDAADRPVVECVRWLIALMMIEWSGTEHKQKHTRWSKKVEVRKLFPATHEKKQSENDEDESLWFVNNSIPPHTNHKYLLGKEWDDGAEKLSIVVSLIYVIVIVSAAVNIVIVEIVPNVQQTFPFPQDIFHFLVSSHISPSSFSVSARMFTKFNRECSRKYVFQWIDK